MRLVEPRRLFSAAAALAAGSVFFGFMTARAGESPAGQPRKPNIVFILSDDVGMGDLGCYGQKLLRTPHIDRLATEGTRFTCAYAGSTVCAPSRCADDRPAHGARRGSRQLGSVPGGASAAARPAT